MDKDYSQLNEGLSRVLDTHGNHLPAVKDYWRNNEYLHYSPIADRIPRDHFLEISQYDHFVDKSTLQPHGSPGHNRLGKVRPVIEHLLANFAQSYHPHKEVAVDEAMIKFIAKAVHASEAHRVRDQSVGLG